MSQEIIQVKNLVTRFGERTILEDLTLSINANEIMVILGPSGCGKTTLLKHILRLHTPTSGQIRLFDADISSMEETEFNQILKRIGVLFQNGALLNSLTVGENIAIPLQLHTTLPEALITRVVRQKLHWVELDQAFDYFPAQLSGGMRKRAALARAIAMDPLLLFGDEPTAGLDPVTAAALDELMLKLKHFLKMTLVIVTHELASIHRIADRVTFLDQGRLLFVGTLAAAKQSNIPQIQEFFEKGRF
ncbi:ATP-binding cassette domain-containing protein [candidate division KSB1 bacterium]|nr:ATP-binding cassette domain-containing protein [candidate division KSB1 bacterium]